jgi:hypothetical protein
LQSEDTPMCSLSRAIAALLLPATLACTVPLAVRARPLAYLPDSLARQLPSSSHVVDTLGCLDVAMSLEGRGAGTALEWRMGNRCDRSVELDTSSLVVTTLAPDRYETLVALLDPKTDVGPRDLEPRRAAVDRIGLLLPADAQRVCVSYFNVSPGASARERPPACFDYENGWARIVERRL